MSTEMRDRAKQQGNWDRRWTCLAVALVAAGVILRLVVWWHQKALWLDELALVRSIEPLGTGQLAQPLGAPWGLNQSAPVGHVAMLWLVIKGLGVSELTLRAGALLAGLGALLMARPLLRRFAGAPGAIFGLAVFALSGGIVYYASDTKQYSTELLVSTLVMLLGVRALEKPCWRRWGALLAAGALGQFLSLPVLFTLAGVYAALAWDWIVTPRPRQRHYTLALGVMAATWLAVFAVNWWLVLGFYSSASGIRVFWTDSYLPWPVSAGAARVYFERFNELHRSLFHLAQPWPRLMLGLVAAVGVILAAARFVRERRPALLMLLVPLGGVLLAGVLKIYPISSRLLYFAVIYWCIFAAIAFDGCCVSGGAGRGG